MEPLLNPYRPGAGLRPPELVGRQTEIDIVDLMVAHSRNRRNDGGLIMYGLRGVGKTVLLSKLREFVESRGWVTVQLEARPGKSGRAIARQSLARGMGMAARRLQRFTHAAAELRAALATVASFTATVGGAGITLGFAPSDHRANSGLLEVDLEEMIEDLAVPLVKNSSALAVFVDEMQDLDNELLTSLLSAQHRASQEGWPFFVIGAGLTTLRRTITEARSYAERFALREVGALSPDAARDAVAKPAAALGATFSEPALDLILRESNGYPFFLQTYGKSTWNMAPGRAIGEEAAFVGIVEGNVDLDQSFFPARWDRTTPLERQYLRALASIGGASASTAAIADELDYAPSSLSPVRQALIEKGLVFAERRGYVSFTVPNMDAFIRRSGAIDDDPS